jgi:hypothetical protein
MRPAMMSEKRLSMRMRWPTDVTPISFRWSSVSPGRCAPAISLA